MKSIILTLLLSACVFGQNGYDKFNTWNNYLTQDTEVVNPYLMAEDANTLAHYVFDDVINTTPLVDLSGNQSNLVPSAGITVASQFTTTGPYPNGGNALVFDGSNDWLETGLVPTTNGSIEMWIKRTGGTGVVVGCQSGTRAYAGLNNRVGGGLGNESWTTILGTTTVNTDWSFIALTWDADSVKMYLNGIKEYSGARAGATPTGIDYYIGCHNNGSEAFKYSGAIAEIRISNIARTQADISNNYEKIN